MDQNEHIMKEQIENAPPEIKKFLVDASWRKVVTEIAQKNNLSAEQATALENEVLFVLLAMELRTDIPKNIVQNAGVSPNYVLSVTAELNERIFSPVMAWLPTETEDVSVSENLMTSQTQLRSATDILPPYNLPTGTALEEKINPLVGSVGDKGAWEQRKKALGENTIVIESKYGSADPYREPIK